ncbi:sensor histidine kinase [Saccharopolyspora gregorii]|uniref:Signal transduction histidine-protein kinase/phosphatase MprB n=1 Tax=Saccharopolyspora gregorii TaxID=33914 RepID=A0ABP6S2G2_9PSEU|nr:HAMP domain-containing sensor histidine kinase [Saccharopolyspora gregorii]
MSPWPVVLIAACESVGVGLLGAAVLRMLRRCSVDVSLVAVVVITVCAMNVSVLTVVLLVGADRLPVSTNLAVNAVAGVVSIGIGLLLGRSVVRGSRRLADAARDFGRDQRFRLTDELPTADLADLARQLRATSDKLAESRKREQAIEASRRQLVAWLSHDLRSPLARLRAMAESLEDGVADDLPHYCRKIRADADRLSDMVDDLFELSRLQSGTLHLTLREVAVDDLVSDAVAGFDDLAVRRGIRLRPDHVEPVTAAVDERMMTRVFNNLLSNALQYSPPGTAVALGVRAQRGWAVVSISDECGGIPPENLAAVFDVGWRGAPRTPGAERGGGLGLSIAQGVVQAHRGHVSVRNVPGGCCFEVLLPLAGG